MDHDRSQSGAGDDLRKQAEARLLLRPLKETELTPENSHRLVHELRTHQIELEIQNEELRRAQHELVESRDRYADLYDFAPVGYTTLSDAGLVEEANLALVSMLGVTRQALVGHHLSTFIAPEDEDIYYRKRREVLDTNQRQAWQLRMLRKDAEPFIVEMVCTPIMTGEAGSIQLRTIITDIAERKGLEEQAQVLQRELGDAERRESLSVLTGGIAHDLNNMLGPLVALPEMVDDVLAELRTATTEDIAHARQNLRIIKDSSLRAAGVVMDLKAIGARGRVELNPLDVNQLVRESLQTIEIRSILSKKKPAIAFRTTLAEGLPVLAGNATDLHRVLQNLLLNAAQATHADGAVELETTTASLSQARHGSETVPPGEYVVIHIRDTGEGIPPALLSRIFEPFVSGSREAGRRSGSGLGLAVVHAVIQDHKGYIDVESGGEWSTTFSLFFPVAIAQAVPSPPARRDNVVPTGTERILVVDDDPTQRFVARRLLEGLGYHVTEAPDGHAALQMLTPETPDSNRHDFDLILLDMIMEPNFSGLDTLRVIRKTDPNQKVVMASGQADDVSARATEALDADWLAKPYRRAGLARAVRERLDGGWGAGDKKT